MLRALSNARLTIDQVAAQLVCSPSKVSRMETGQRDVAFHDVRDLRSLYGVAEAVEGDNLLTLAREAKQRGWWQSYHLSFATYAELEAAAEGIRSFTSASCPAFCRPQSMHLRRTKGSFWYYDGAHPAMESNFNILDFDPDAATWYMLRASLASHPRIGPVGLRMCREV